VLARGAVPADVLFIGEAPGASEDAIGRPFVGPAGKLLDHIIATAVEPRLRFALTNLIACIPRGEDGIKTSEPDISEVLTCAPRLVEFYELCRPMLVVAVGATARDYIERSLPDMTCPWTDITHPAAILRANIMQRDLAVQRCVVKIKQAIEAVERGDSSGGGLYGASADIPF
jgi:uracil-DNA glycosylase